MKRYRAFFIISGFCCLLSCSGNDNDKTAVVDPHLIYFDYQVTGEEGSDSVTVMIQYRLKKRRGPSIRLHHPSHVQLDGKTIAPDSTKITGPYYATQLDVAGFTGKHEIVFTDINKKQYREEFYFQPVIFGTSIPDTIIRESIDFQLKGLNDTDRIRLVLYDTSRHNDEINRLHTVINGKVSISRADLEMFKKGPLYLDILREEDRPVMSTTAAGGRIAITYSLKRELFLK